MKPARILVAVRPEPLPTVTAALAGYDLLLAKDVEHGQSLILEHDAIDLFVIGILFDDSKAMELIKTIRLDNTTVPIIVTRFMPSQHAEMLQHVMDTMMALGTVSAYFERPLGEPRLHDDFRALVEKYLPKDKRLKSLKKGTGQHA